MKPLARMLGWTCALLAPLGIAHADRGTGWEFGADLLYQDSQDIAFDGGSGASIEDDIGLGITFGYRFNDRLELQFGVDWQNVDYEVTVLSDASLGLQQFTGRGELERFTPRAAVVFNFFEGDLTPYVTGGVGWSFIDTNIPNAPPQNVCWWDPWFGYVCGQFQSTRTLDELTYNAGVGLRWDVSPGYTMKLSYEKQWLDLGTATSTPDFDQLRLGVTFRY
jgi:opacity protein-like surface antigen